jgi:hypothetical protein
LKSEPVAVSAANNKPVSFAPGTIWAIACVPVEVVPTMVVAHRGVHLIDRQSDNDLIALDSLNADIFTGQ